MLTDKSPSVETRQQGGRGNFKCTFDANALDNEKNASRHPHDHDEDHDDDEGGDDDDDDVDETQRK